MAKLAPNCFELTIPNVVMQIAGVFDLKDGVDIVYWCLFLYAFFLLAQNQI